MTLAWFTFIFFWWWRRMASFFLSYSSITVSRQRLSLSLSFITFNNILLLLVLAAGNLRIHSQRAHTMLVASISLSYITTMLLLLLGAKMKCAVPSADNWTETICSMFSLLCDRAHRWLVRACAWISSIVFLLAPAFFFLYVCLSVSRWSIAPKVPFLGWIVVDICDRN